MTPEDFKYPFYIKDAKPEGVAEALVWLREFYCRYPTGAEWGEAMHQLRRELDLIKEVEQKKKKVKQLIDELDDE